MGILETLIISVVGMAVVFAVLIILMLCISIMSKLMKKSKPEAAAPAPVPAAAAPAADAGQRPAKGSCGEIKLFDVPDKTAAMLMAITADKIGAPLNTLRFISIKEVK